MRRFRKITVDNIEYKWLFRYDDYDYINYPYLLIVMNASPKAALRINFPITDHFLLNSGLPATFHGKKVVINLNHPSYAAQIIHQCRETGEDFSQDGYKHFDGIKILQKIGYEIPPILLTKQPVNP